MGEVMNKKVKSSIISTIVVLGIIVPTIGASARQIGDLSKLI